MTKGYGTLEELKEQLKDITEKKEIEQLKIESLEKYAIRNHHAWSRERIFKESQILTDACLRLADLEEDETLLSNEIKRRELRKKEYEERRKEKEKEKSKKKKKRTIKAKYNHSFD